MPISTPRPRRPSQTTTAPVPDFSSPSSRSSIPTTAHPPKSSPQLVPETGLSSKNGNWKRKRHLGKPIDLDVEDTGKDRVKRVDVAVPEHESHRLLFKETMETATRTGLDKLRLTQPERVVILRVLKYNIHAGRFYPFDWYSAKDGLNFFTDFLKFQGWHFLAQFQGNVYPIEVIQFFASVSFKDGVLKAVVNGQNVSVSCEEFAQEFQIPNGGLAIVPGADWDGYSLAEKIAFKQYFDDRADASSAVLAAPFAPNVKFLLNFLWNTVVPRRGGRDKLASYEIMIMKAWLEGERVNLPLLIFHRIHQLSTIVTDLKFSTTFDIPYGMWVSRLLEVKGVVGAASYGVQPRDRMSDKLLKLMGLAVNGPSLIFREKNSSLEAGVVGSSDMGTVSAGFESKLTAFMDPVDARMDEQSSMLAAAGLESVHHSPTPSVLLESRLFEWMTGVDERLQAHSSVLACVQSEVQAHTSVLASIKETLRTELPFQRKYLGVISSRAEGLYADGGAVIAEVQGMKEVLATVVSQVVDFAGRLQTQTGLVNSCLDRLTDLEYRTRPDYQNPYETIPPENYDSDRD